MHRLKRTHNEDHTSMEAPVYGGRGESARQFVFMTLLHKP